MQGLQLNNDLVLAIENSGKKLRLVVYEKGVEKVCRKETYHNLLKFIQSPTGHLFKGRLQLDKTKERIDIVVKGELTGFLTIDEFIDLLEKT